MTDTTDTDTSNIQNTFKNTVFKAKNNFNEFATKSKNVIENFIGKENFKHFNDNKIMAFSIFIFIIILIFVATFGYDKYVKPLLNPDYVPNKEFIKSKNNNIFVYFFYTNWCPYCKKARSEWSQFMEDTNNDKQLNEAFNIVFQEVDCDKEPDLAKQFNIQGYPTIKLVKDNKIFNYDAKPDANNLTQFLKGSL